MLTEAKKLVEAMLERVRPGPDGEKKVFRDSLVVNMREWLSEAPFRNLSNSTELDAIVRQMRDALGNIEPDELRASGTLRSIVSMGMNEVAAVLDTCLAKAPSRKIIVMKPAPANGAGESLPAVGVQP